jgi:hypothetical protein
MRIDIENTSTISRSAEYVRFGMPFGRGELPWPGDTAPLVQDADGNTVRTWSEPAAWWDDGSVKWLLIEYPATVEAGSTARYALRTSASPAPTPTPQPGDPDTGLTLTDTLPGAAVVHGGGVELAAVRTAAGSYSIDIRSAAGCMSIDPLGLNSKADDPGHECAWGLRPANVACRLEARLPTSASLRLESDMIQDQGEPVGKIICRVTCYAGSAHVLLEHTYIHASDLREQRLHDAGVIIRADPDAPDHMSLGVSHGALQEERSMASVRVGIDGKTTERYLEEPLRLFQTNDDRPAPPTFAEFAPAVYGDTGYVSAGPRGKRLGGRLDGWLSAQDRSGALTVAVEDLWQQYPKEIVVGVPTIIRLLTRDMVEDGKLDLDWAGGVRQEDISPTGAPWRCYGEDGVGKTHRVWLAYGTAAAAPSMEQQAQAFLQPLHARIPAQRYAQTRVLGDITPASPEHFPRTEQTLQRAVEWITRHMCEWFNWYGMLNWGGIQTHFLPEEGHWTNLVERFGWINEETEPRLGVLMQYVRSGDPRWLRLGRVMVRHISDVDTVQLGDRSGFMRRHFAVHFGQAGDMSHTFAGPLCLLYYLTGDDRVNDVIELVAQRSVAHMSTGYERDSTDAMKNCLWCYERTGDIRYRAHGELILQNILSHVATDGGVGLPHDTGFHTNLYFLSAVLLHERMLGPDAIKDTVLRVMNYEISPRGRDDDPNVSRGNSFEGLAFAYRMTGNTKYLYAGIKDLAALPLSRVYQIYEPGVRFPSAGVDYYRPPEGELAPDSFTSVHWLGHALTMVPPFLAALQRAGITEDSLPIDGGLHGNSLPYSLGGAGVGNLSGVDAATRFLPLCLAGAANLPALARDPFDYTREVERVPTLVDAVEIAVYGQLEDNLTGLPWGMDLVVGGIPFSLPKVDSEQALCAVVLTPGADIPVPVGVPLERLHILGNVASRGTMEPNLAGAVYRIVFEDGSSRDLTATNMADYEDWRYLHYSPRAPAAFAWYPKQFSLIEADAAALAQSDWKPVRRQTQDDGLSGPVHIPTPFGSPLVTGTHYWLLQRFQRVRHLNLLSIETGGKLVREIRLMDGGASHGVFLVALTGEVVGTRPGTIDTASFGQRSVRVEGERAAHIAADGDWICGDGRITCHLEPGEWYVALRFAGGPARLTLNMAGQRVVTGMHLSGSWCRDWPPLVQTVGTRVRVNGGVLEIDIAADGGQLYDGPLKSPGGYGWHRDSVSGRWVRHGLEPWSLVEMTASPMDSGDRP